MKPEPVAQILESMRLPGKLTKPHLNSNTYSLFCFSNKREVYWANWDVNSVTNEAGFQRISNISLEFKDIPGLGTAVLS